MHGTSTHELQKRTLFPTGFFNTEAKAICLRPGVRATVVAQWTKSSTRLNLSDTSATLEATASVYGFWSFNEEFVLARFELSTSLASAAESGQPSTTSGVEVPMRRHAQSRNGIAQEQWCSFTSEVSARDRTHTSSMAPYSATAMTLFYSERVLNLLTSWSRCWNRNWPITFGTVVS